MSYNVQPSDFVYKRDGFTIPIAAVFNGLTTIEQECVTAYIAAETRKARIEGEIIGLSTFAIRDRKSFRVNSSIMSIDSKDILRDIADCYERIAELQKETEPHA